VAFYLVWLFYLLEQDQRDQEVFFLCSLLYPLIPGWAASGGAYPARWEHAGAVVSTAACAMACASR